MPINVTVKEPWSRVVSSKSESDIVARGADSHDVSANRVIVVVSRASSTSHDREGMLKAGKR